MSETSTASERDDELARLREQLVAADAEVARLRARVADLALEVRAWDHSYWGSIDL